MKFPNQKVSHSQSQSIETKSLKVQVKILNFIGQSKQSSDKLDKKISSNRQSNSERMIDSGGISYDSDFSIDNYGYVGDLDKIATGSGSINSPRYIADNQGHNYIKNSDVDGNLVILVIATNT